MVHPIVEGQPSMRQGLSVQWPQREEYSPLVSEPLKMPNSLAVMWSQEGDEEQV